MGRLDGKVAVVTGGARGIGEATASRLAAEGATVIVTDRRVELGMAVAERLGAAFAELDVCDEKGWQALVSGLDELHVLVNCAGIMRISALVDTDARTFREVLDVNVVGAFLGIKAVTPAMQRAGGGSIINFSSPQGFEGREGMSAYSASKFAIRGLTRTAALELGPSAIRVNSVVPGPTRTPMTARPGWEDADYELAYAGLPLARMAYPSEIAALCAFLASDDASYSTGCDFIADGGVLAGKPSR